MVVLDRLEGPKFRQWYAARDAAQGWSRAVLETMVASEHTGHLHSRQPEQHCRTLDHALGPSDVGLLRNIQTSGDQGPSADRRAEHPQIPACPLESRSPFASVSDEYDVGHSVHRRHTPSDGAEGCRSCS